MAQSEGDWLQTELFMGLGRHARLYRFLEQQAVGLSWGMAGLVFVVDLFTPLGVASAVPYCLAILLALNGPRRQFAVACAVVCSILTVSDVFVGPGRGGSELWKVLTNRSLALFMIWITLTLGMLRKRADQRRREAEALTRLHLSDLAHMSRLETASQLAETMAHELNQPLAAISLQAEIAQRLWSSDRHTSPQFAAALQELTEQSHRSAEVIRSLRRLFHKCESKRSAVDLNEVVTDVVRLMNVPFEQAQVGLQSRLQATQPRVVGDRIQLEQVLLNLLQNALDAVKDIEQGLGHVTVETHDVDHDWMMVSVKDNGGGLRVDDPEQVFERFYSSKPRGMGMGLAISRSIIESHGGMLWAESRENGGAVFRFRLPRGATTANNRVACDDGRIG